MLCDAFEKSLQGIAGTPDTYFLVVTRGHRYDRACLEQILHKPYAYVGMMASRGRSAFLKNQMEEDGFDRAALDGIHTPVGLSIHAETPEEIAVSIVAELIQTKNQTKKTSGYDPLLMEYLTGAKETEPAQDPCDDHSPQRFRTTFDRNQDAGTWRRKDHRHDRRRLHGKRSPAPVPETSP